MLKPKEPLYFLDLMWLLPESKGVCLEKSVNKSEYSFMSYNLHSPSFQDSDWWFT